MEEQSPSATYVLTEKEQELVKQVVVDMEQRRARRLAYHAAVNHERRRIREASDAATSPHEAEPEDELQAAKLKLLQAQVELSEARLRKMRGDDSETQATTPAPNDSSTKHPSPPLPPMNTHATSKETTQHAQPAPETQQRPPQEVDDTQAGQSGQGDRREDHGDADGVTETLRIEIFAPHEVSPEELARIIAGAREVASLIDELRGSKGADSASAEPEVSNHEPEKPHIRPVYRMTPKGRVMVGFTSDTEPTAEKPETPSTPDAEKAELDAVAMIAAKQEQIEKKVSTLHGYCQAVAFLSGKQCEITDERLTALDKRLEHQLRLIGKLHRRVRELEGQSRRPVVIQHQLTEVGPEVLRDLAAISAMRALITPCPPSNYTHELVATFALEVADALLAKLSRPDAAQATA